MVAARPVARWKKVGVLMLMSMSRQLEAVSAAAGEAQSESYGSKRSRRCNEGAHNERREPPSTCRTAHCVEAHHTLSSSSVPAWSRVPRESRCRYLTRAVFPLCGPSGSAPRTPCDCLSSAVSFHLVCVQAPLTLRSRFCGHTRWVSASNERGRGIEHPRGRESKGCGRDREGDERSKRGTDLKDTHTRIYLLFDIFPPRLHACTYVYVGALLRTERLSTGAALVGGNIHTMRT